MGRVHGEIREKMGLLSGAAARTGKLRKNGNKKGH